jgi:HTH-type transcriptional regulator/antitoxin HigA
MLAAMEVDLTPSLQTLYTDPAAQAPCDAVVVRRFRFSSGCSMVPSARPDVSASHDSGCDPSGASTRTGTRSHSPDWHLVLELRKSGPRTVVGVLQLTATTLSRGGSMDNATPAEVFAPGAYLQEMLDGRGWTQSEFAEIIGRPVQAINKIVNGKSAITPTTAKEFGAALGTSPLLWLNLEASYQLHHAPEPAVPRIARHAELRGRYPVREMVNRGWIAPSSDPDVLERQVLRFFGLDDLTAPPRLAHAAKKTGYPEDLNGAQLAWLFRVRQIAEAMTVPAYSEKRLREAIPTLADLLLAPEEVRHVPRILADCGVRSSSSSTCRRPRSTACASGSTASPRARHRMSLRRDKIDNFWFVLRHEIEHVLQKHGRDVAIIDADMAEPGAEGGLPDGASAAASEEERLANAAAAEFLRALGRAGRLHPARAAAVLGPEGHELRPPAPRAPRPRGRPAAAPLEPVAPPRPAPRQGAAPDRPGGHDGRLRADASPHALTHRP